MKNRLGFAAFFVCFALVGCGRSPESNAPADSMDKAQSAPKPSHATYSLEWISNDVPPQMSHGPAVLVHVSVKNTGDWAWNDPVSANPSQPNGTYAVRLSYRWVGPDGRAEQQNSIRGELTKPVPPGETANFSIAVSPPNGSGSYKLEIDLVEELVNFFSNKGTQKLVVPVAVQ